MYISKKKRVRDISRNVSGIDSVIAESVTAEDVMAESVSADSTAEVSETLELEREIFLEPEEEMSADELRGEEYEEDERNDIEVPEDPQDLDTGEQSERVLTYEEFMRQNTDEGVLRVQASAGGQSIPLSNVNIVVYRDFADGRHIFYTVVTNADGVADGMILPAPPRVNSVEGNGQSPFASYVVTADREGLRGQTIENVPIFSGVKSIQPVNLSPEQRKV